MRGNKGGKKSEASCRDVSEYTFAVAGKMPVVILVLLCSEERRRGRRHLFAESMGWRWMWGRVGENANANGMATEGKQNIGNIVTWK